MGKKTDLFVATILPGVLLWFYFRRRLESKLLCFAAALIACFLWGKLLRRALTLIGKLPFLRKRRLRKCAGGVVLRLAGISEDKARENIASLIRKCYSEGEYPLEIIQQHPALKLSESAIFQAWRKHMGKDRLVICATCRTDPGIRAFASGLTAPKIALIDSDMLSQMIAEYPDGMPTERAPKAKMRLRHAVNLLINRKNAPKNLLFSATMLAMYLLSGNYYYLSAAILLLALVFLSLRRKMRPNKLF